MILCSFDPGFSGGMTIFKDGLIVLCIPMPIKTVKCGKKDRKRINAVEVSKELKLHLVEHVIIEQVHAFPGQGGVGNFSFGQNFGTLLSVFEALGIPYEEVSPMRWKKAVLGNDYNQGKDQGVVFCGVNYPHINLHRTSRCKKPHDGMSDSICIGHYFLQKHINNKKEE